ncbi:MAG: iron-sulfur cluster assembly scaffold protein [Candidatus Bathyarchaeia archaeon]
MLKLTKKEEILLKAGYSIKAIKLYVNVEIIDNSDVIATYTGLLYGDTITLYLKINKNTGIIENAKFQYKGCVGTANSGSALTALIIGKTVRETGKITEEYVLKELDGLSESHCANLLLQRIKFY